jgi:hypothetical protein
MNVLLLGVIVLLSICLAFSFTAFIVTAGFILLLALSVDYDRFRLRCLAQQRMGDSICTFARSFNRRVVDPWVVRATYEEFHAYYDRLLPIRASDGIEEDLKMDWDDVDDLLADVAFRAGRSLENLELNPLYGQVRNVGDLVLFLMYQPKSGAA